VRYSLRRPGLAGRGPIEVFRVIEPQSGPPPRQVPQKWLLGQNAYRALQPDPRPETAVALVRANAPNVQKVWTEMAYEAVRTEIAPTAPPRFEAVFAFADPLEAISFPFQFNLGVPKWVYRGTVDETVPWRMVDMVSFSVVQPADTTTQGFADAWEVARRQAQGYWAPSDDVRIAEILVGGSVELTTAVVPLPLLRELGVIE